MFIFASLFAGSAGMTLLTAEECRTARAKKMLVQGVTHPTPRQDELVAMVVASVGGERDEESTEKHWRERHERFRMRMQSLNEKIKELNNRCTVLAEVVTQTKHDLSSKRPQLEKAKSELQSTLSSDNVLFFVFN